MHRTTYQRLWDADEEAATANDLKFVAMVRTRYRKYMAGLFGDGAETASEK